MEMKLLPEGCTVYKLDSKARPIAYYSQIISEGFLIIATIKQNLIAPEQNGACRVLVTAIKDHHVHFIDARTGKQYKITYASWEHEMKAQEQNALRDEIVAIKLEWTPSVMKHNSPWETVPNNKVEKKIEIRYGYNRKFSME